MNEKVLVIDDEPDSVSSICDDLNDLGITCRGESDPEKAIESFRASPTDIVVVDYLLSDVYGITGLDVISALKDIKPFTRFVLISGYIPIEEGDEEISEKVNQIKVDRIIAKPLKPGVLADLIRELLEDLRSKSNDWLAKAKEYVSKKSVTPEEIRAVNEEFKQSIIEALEEKDQK